MAGQFQTRRGASGRIEKIPEAEQGALMAAAEGIKPPPTMADFIKEAPAEPPPLPAGPPPLPPAGTPPPLPSAPAAKPPVMEETPVADATKAAAGVASSFGPAGAAIGTAAGYMVGSASGPPRQIGTLEGGKSQNDPDDTMKNILSVLQETARTGNPIKGAVPTVAAGSRM